MYGYSLISPGNYSGEASIYPPDVAVYTAFSSYYIASTYAGLIA